MKTDASPRAQPDRSLSLPVIPVARRNRFRHRVLPLLVALCFAGNGAWANPAGPQVVNGQAGFFNQGNTLSITNSPGAIINWQSFSISPGELTRFNQQNSSSSVLNRIVGLDPSKILGALQSNGRVFLINPNGILFGQGAQVDVNGLVASTLNISNADFISGKMNFQAGTKAGDISHQGAITTPSGGQVYLIAPNIENTGIITSPKGEVLLAAGRSVQLVDSTNPDLHVVVSAPENQALNLGQIVAQGGRVGIYGALITQRGIVSADSAVVGENGKITFKASRDAILDTGSRTSATGAGNGGEVRVLGERVALAGDAKIDVHGQTAGGTVLVGGDYQGKNPTVQNAKRVYIGQDTVIDADAKQTGNGGRIIVWSDEATRAYGKLSARGGAKNGNGGFVEVSGKQYLDFRAQADLRAANGFVGTLLLDPNDITIQATGTTDTSLSGGPSFTFSGGPASATLTVTDLQNQLSLGNVTVSTSAGGGGPNGGRITVADPVAWGNSNTLDLSASSDIVLNASVTGGTGSLIKLNAGTSGSITGNGQLTAASFDLQGTSTGAIGTAGSPLKTSSVGGSGNAAIRIGVSGTGPSAVYLTHTGDATLDPTSTFSANAPVSVTASNNLTATTINSGTSNLDLSAGNLLTIPGTASVGGANVTLSANRMDFQAGSGINASAGGTIWLKPSSAGWNIDLGSGVDSTAGTLELSATELNVPNTSGVLRVGALTAGNLNVSAAVAPSNATAFSIEAGGTITQGALATITANKLAIKSLGDVTLNTASNSVTNLAAQLGNGSNQNKSILFKNAGGLNVGGGIDGVSGISTVLDVTGYNPVTPNGFIALQSTGGGITQTPGITLGAKAVYAEGVRVMLDTANPVGVIAGKATGSGTGDVFNFVSSNGIALSKVNGFFGVEHTGSPPDPASILLTAGSAGISQDSVSPVITSGGLKLMTSGQVSLGSAASNSVGSLTATGTGGLNFNNAGNLTLGVSGSGITASNQPISITSGGLLIVKELINAGNGSVTLKAQNIQIGSSLGTTIDGSAVSLSATQPGSGVISSAGSASGITSSGTSGTLTGINLQADNLNFSAAPVTFAASNAIAYRTVSDDRSIATSSLAGGTYNAPYLVIGNQLASSPDTTGSIVVDSAINRPGQGLVLLAGGSISQTGTILAKDLAIQAGTVSGNVTLNLGNQVTNLAVSTNGGTCSIVNAAALNIGTVTDGIHTLSGIVTGGGALGLTTGAGNITIASPIAAGTGNVALTATGGAINQSGSSSIVAGSLNLVASGGIGNGTSLITQVGSLAADNSGANTSIDITNTGALTLQNVKQSGGGSGNIIVANTGALTVGAGRTVSTGSGNIQLIAHSPLTVGGTVSSSAGGSITLEAGATGSVNDKLTVSSSGLVSTSGNILMKAGDKIVLLGTVNGNLTSQSDLNGTSTTPPPPTTTPPSTTTPTIDQCIGNPSLAGCSSVLPSIGQCTATPSLAGCSVVLPSLSQCTTTPTLSGCSAVLPSLSQCTATPTLSGCSAVLPSLGQCTATPTLSGCSAVLPSLGQCTATPTLSGCSAVLPSLGQCTATPTLSGCSAVLPSLSQCTLTPTLAGCSVVLPSLGQCTTTPTLSGCTAVLPSLSQCTATPTLAGCSAVLPSLSQCTGNPTLAGCAAVLPTLSQCTLTPTLSGCSAVLPPLTQCTANPALAGCTAVLPTLSQCTANPDLPGCGAVLPPLSQCALTPTLAGCSAVLPSLSQCAANPALPGCSIVLPPLQPRADEPTTSQSPVTAVLNTVLTTTSSVVVREDGKGGTGTAGNEKSSDSKKDVKKDTTGSNERGTRKDDAATKMYCN